MEDAPKTYCISLRLRRTIIEDAYVAVPLTTAITKQREDGSTGIDTDAFFELGVRMGDDPRVEWRVESVSTEPHPTQQARPNDRTTFDIHDHSSEC